MISEHVEACDKLIANAQKLLDEVMDLPVTKGNMRLIIGAENTLKLAQQYKSNSLKMYDSFFNYIKDSHK